MAAPAANSWINLQPMLTGQCGTDLELLKVLDVPFDGSRAQPGVLLLLHDGNDLADRLRTLPAQAQDTARVFDIYVDKDYSALIGFARTIDEYLSEEYTELRDRGSIIWEGGDTPFASHDIENVSLQWNQSTEGFASPPAIWTATALRGRAGPKMSPRDSSLKCLNIGDDKLLAIRVREWPPCALPVTTRMSGFYAFNALDEGRLSGIDRLASNNGFLAMGNGTREQFTKLLVLDFFASSIYLYSATKLSKCYDYCPEAGVILEILRVTNESSIEDGLGHYIEQLNRCETVLEDMHRLSEAIDFVVGVLLKDCERTVNAAAKSIDWERVSTLQKLCHQRLNCTRRSIDRLNRSFDAQDKVHNIQESTSVKRLTILATIFLPLSLSTSILSMQSRFVDLKLKLYDFIGVFVIVGTVAVLILLIVSAVSRIKSSMRHFRVSLRTRELQAMLYWWFCGIIWAIVLVSFIVGMVRDVKFGLYILCYGFLGSCGYIFIVALVVQTRDRCNVY